MNELQCLKQMRYLLRAQEWSSGVKVFQQNSVRVTLGPAEDGLRWMSPPLLMLRPDSVESDPLHDEQPDLIRCTVMGRIVQSIEGDDVGENVLLGANRSGLTAAQNRGLFEIEEQMYAAVGKLNEINGVKLFCRMKGAVLADLDPVLGYIAWRDYSFEVFCTMNRFYHAATKFVATGGVGQVVLTWTLPPDRFDRQQMFLRRAAGITPPATVTDGTGVTLASALATGVTDSGLAPGTYSYSLFAGYDDFEDNTVRSYSAAVSKASVTVT